MKISHKYTSILTLLMLLTVGSCSGPSVTDVERINRAKTLIDSHPDSAIAILDSIDHEHIGEYKAYAHYLKGKGKLNLQNYPDATTEFLRAEKFAIASDNDSVLKLTLHEIMSLADSVCDINIKAAFAARLGNIYFGEKDYDNVYQVLSKINKIHYSDIISVNNRTELEKLAQRFKESDTMLITASSDTLTRRGDLIYNKIRSINNLSAFPIEIIDNLSSPYFTQLSPQDAHNIVTTLWEHDREEEARDFMTYVSSCFTDRAGREFRSSFRYDIKEAAKQFNHDELLIREQIIKYQRILLVAVSILAIAIIVIIAIYIRISRMRRRQLEEQSMLSASELRTSLHDLEEENLGILGHLCDTYYENYANESAKSCTARETLRTIRKMASSDEFIARLEKHLDHTSENVMTLFRTELPGLKDSDRLLFLYNALGLSIPSMCIMLDARREVIYNRRVRLRARIEGSGTQHKDILLKYLQ